MPYLPTAYIRLTRHRVLTQWPFSKCHWGVTNDRNPTKNYKIDIDQIAYIMYKTRTKYIFKRIFSIENVLFPITIPLKCVRNGPVNNQSALVPVICFAPVMRQVINWTNVSPDLWRHMSSLAHNSHHNNFLLAVSHDDVIKWKHFPRNWPFVRGIHRSRWIPHTKASDAELWCLLWSASE